jgi:glycosyltransferase involved in cell wall biosynthesis
VQARGDLVLFLDSDDRYRPGHLARRRALHAAQGSGIVIGRFRLDDGIRQWDGPMADYAGGEIEDYIFAGGGDARSSTISLFRPIWRGTSFDPTLAKHQDWGFALAAGRNGEAIGFDPEPGVVISVAGSSRMSARSDPEASLAFAHQRLRGIGNRRRFLLGRLRTSLRLGDLPAARRFRAALLALDPAPRERWGSAAMLLAAQMGIAAPLHRLIAGRR